MSCQCYQIGGPFIAEDPDCPQHGQNRDELEQAAIAEVQAWGERFPKEVELLAEVQAWRDRFPQYIYRPQDDGVFLKMES